MLIETGFQIDVNDSYKWFQWRKSRGGLGLNIFQKEYEKRVIADGGVVESLKCVNAIFTVDYNWNYYFRVVNDGGVVESLECTKIN